MSRKSRGRATQQRAVARGAAARAAARGESIHFGSVALVCLLVLYCVVLVRTAWLSDDAYITFRTIDNFINGDGLRWNVAERVQAYTHPLWMLVLAAGYAVTRQMYLTAIVVSIVVSLAAVALLGWYYLRRHVDPLLLATGIGILVLSRAFVDYSTSGLENPLTHLLLVAFVVLLFDERPAQPKRLFLLSMVAGLATWNRMDVGLLVLPALAHALWRGRSWKAAALVLLGFAPFVCWEVFSVIYYGFPFPNTAYAKLRTGISRAEYWRHGVVYFVRSLAVDPLTMLAIAGGIIVGLIGRTWKQRALAAGVVLYLLYIINIGGDFMVGRFFAAPLLICVMLLLDWDRYPRGIWARRLLPIAVVLLGLIGATPTVQSGGAYGTVRGAVLHDSGVADERAFYYPLTGLLSGTPMADRPPNLEGRTARGRGDPLVVAGATGFTGFMAGPGSYIVDYHALGDPLLARLPMVKADPIYVEFCIQQIGRPCADPWRTGHYLRNIPDGYVDSVLDNENRLADDGLRRYYDAIRLITRGPIWSAERWRAIARVNLGFDDHLLGAREQVDYRVPQLAATYERHPDVPSVSLLAGACRNYVERNAVDQAIACYQRLVAIEPTFHEGWNNLGQMLLVRGDAAGAEAALREAIKQRPGRIEPYVSLGDLMRATGRQTEAIRLFEQMARNGDVFAAAFLRQIGTTASPPRNADTDITDQ